jgi:hypothetical protein
VTLHRVVGLEHRVVELVGVEVLLGVEDLADADVAVHRLANDRERLGQHVARFELAGHQPLAQLLRAGAELLVGQGLDLRLLRVDLLDDLAETLEEPLVAAAEDFGEDFLDGERIGHLCDCESRIGDCGLKRRRPRARNASTAHGR